MDIQEHTGRRGRDCCYTALACDEFSTWNPTCLPPGLALFSLYRATSYRVQIPYLFLLPCRIGLYLFVCELVSGACIAASWQAAQRSPSVPSFSHEPSSSFTPHHFVSSTEHKGDASLTSGFLPLIRFLSSSSLALAFLPSVFFFCLTLSSYPSSFFPCYPRSSFPPPQVVDGEPMTEQEVEGLQLEVETIKEQITELQAQQQKLMA